MKDDSHDILDRATSLCQDERELEAEVLVKEQLARNPNNLELMTKLGEIQARLCKDNEAEFTFRSILDRNPHHEDAICKLGRLLDQELRTEEAELLYRNFLQKNPMGHCALEDLCRLLVSENRTDEALRLARDQVKQYGENVNAYSALQYVLQIIEDDLDFDMDDDRGNETIFTQLVNNLFEQLEIVTTLESNLEIHEDLQLQLEDDKIRLISELEHLLDNAACGQISVPEEFHSRLQSFK